jgi:hypothetical protein
MKYIMLVAILFVWLGMDVDFYLVVSERGGWDAYVATNFLWQSAVSALVVWNIIGCICASLWWICRND